MLTEKEIESQSIAARKTAFEAFMSQPTIRLLTSMIPAGDHQDTLNTLLQESFNSGWNNGSGNLAATFLKAMLDPRRPQ